MFMKAMRSKPVRLVLYTVLGAFGLYNGASCLVTLYKAGNQPYLLSGTERFDFMGYHMMAAMHGATCIVLAVTLILLVRWIRKTESNQA
jgi:hypothetical protein